MPTHDITLEIKKRNPRVPPRVVVRVGDIASQTISAQITSDGQPYTSPLSNVRLDILRADGTWARITATKSGSKVSCTLPSQAVSSAGTCKLAHFVFFSGSTKAESTEDFELAILPNVDTSDAHAEAESYDDLLTKLWEKWDAYGRQAEASESARVSAENARKANETARESAEETRKQDEEQRKTDEAARKQAESSRAGAETSRKSAESSRVTAEASRVTAEQQRATEHARLKTASQQATSAANTAASSANAAASRANGAAAIAQSALNIANSVTTAEEYDRQDSIGAYAGRSLASVFASEISSKADIYAWLKSRAQAGNFSGLRIGDYIDVPVAEAANVPAQTVRYRIGAIDQYYRCGDIAKGHHIVMVPKAPVTVKGDKASNTSYLQWRETRDNNGTAEERHPYLCSKLHDWEINDFLPALPSGLQSALMTQRVLLEERYSASGKLTEASNCSLTDLGKIWSPSEMEVYGCPVWGSKGHSVGFDSQFPIFTDTASRIAGGRVSWWLRSVVGGSSSNACYVYNYGVAYFTAPKDDWVRPLPCFLLG
ncbi:MAG: DUF6273 domain-containing protein [Coriobacteriaceae bacterium]|uniref:DUF6273 domain-containing protein n=1 Tax=Tractidigestivibacter sp. TaxID=2847320 RepID=UPI002A83AED4|nr:DUF6273 domain-containing protein [Tractidigestivibacter sp.]MCI6274436.1 DUF6273 domain-containing protein [Coriobacteriaceae bacterium]MCI6548187.1 DUF6273 domain-containing protein [Coriobacteriaceae bacterium]MCI6845313.1 DUF6273 domain-containing protein [Coriobacteriaceae bacterium]MDY4535494.1 DUF6273 domain-containing protein [Tractidigestivibacter sp.]MDY5272121.1 DUF6273 domain-containing protein [Tractidigestivibacter sp.]